MIRTRRNRPPPPRSVSVFNDCWSPSAPSGSGTGRHDVRPTPATPRPLASSGRSASPRASSASRCRPSLRPAGPVAPLERPGDLAGMVGTGSGRSFRLSAPPVARLWECRIL